MIAPYAQATQNNNKCPHGLPIGTCPICNGMHGGGASRDKNKPRRAGEMSYNECLAAWHKMQQAKADKIQARLDKIEMAKSLAEAQNKLMAKMEAKIANFHKNYSIMNDKIAKLPVLLRIPAKILSAIAQPIVNLIAKIPQAIKNVQAFFSNTIQFVSSVAEKLSSFLGEMKNFVEGFNFINKTKKSLKTFLNLFTQKGSEDEEENEEIQKTKLRELKKVIKGLLRKKSKQEEDLEKDESHAI